MRGLALLRVAGKEMKAAAMGNRGEADSSEARVAGRPSRLACCRQPSHRTKPLAVYTMRVPGHRQLRGRVRPCTVTQKGHTQVCVSVLHQA